MTVTQLELDVEPLTIPPAVGTIQEQFEAFHLANPQVYRLLVAHARELAARGRRRIGIKMLWEVLRWRYMLVADDPSGFKLNNNYTARYARLIAEQEPDLAGLFETRELRA